MTRILVNGAAGHMGQHLVNLINASDTAVLAACVDKISPNGDISADLYDVKAAVDVAVDFSHHTAVGELTKWAREKKIPLVIATTGHDEKEKEMICEAAKEIPVFYAANFSMGVALMADTVRVLAAAFPDADVEIVEKHHNRKVDAPSGTALMLFNAVKDARPDAEAVIGRAGMCPRKKNDVGISSLRMGNLAGEHEVVFTTETQSISIKHEAYDRKLFAEGALLAAEFMAGKSAGLYGMKELLSGK